MDFALQNKINRRIHHLKNDGVMYISGTVSPAESDKETNDIESLEKALAYFIEKGVETIHVQPKWMGSRCQIYLHKDTPEKNFAVSRNGYPIKINMDLIYKNWEWIFDYITTYKFNLGVKANPTRIILDGELLPWKVIGGSLIDREFKTLIKCVDTELNFLEEYGLEEARATVRVSDDLYSFYDDIGLDKKELVKRYPRYETYNNFSEINNFDIQQERNDLELYERQLALYASDGELCYKAFDILRIDFDDGTFNVDDGFLSNTFYKFSILNRTTNDIAGVGIRTTPHDFTTINEYMQKLINNGYEGIMIKPDSPNSTDAVHCIKVRNKEYLRIIYGYDYQREDKLRELVSRKRVGKKRKLSHHEYKLGKEMLKLDITDIDFERKYDTIAKQLLFEIEEENTLDIRL